MIHPLTRGLVWRRFLAVFCIIAAVLVLASGSVLAQISLRVAAVVNDDIITAFDLEQRVRLAAVAGGRALDLEALRQLTPQVLRRMIDERLQIQAAEGAEYSVPDQDIAQQLAGIAERNGQSVEEFSAYLETQGATFQALRAQIEAQLLWRTYVVRRLRRTVQVGDEEIDEELAAIADARTRPQRQLNLIYLSGDEDGGEQAIGNIYEQLLAGGDFQSLARAFSQDTSSRNGGSLGWVREGTFEEEIEDVLRSLQVGDISPPVSSLAGHYIFQVLDIRTPNIERIFFDILQVAFPQEVASSTSDLIDLVNRIRPDGQPPEQVCAQLQTSAEEQRDQGIPMQVAVLDQIASSDLRADLQEIIVPMGLGDISAPQAMGDQWVIFAVCERAEEEIPLPEREAIENQIRAEKLQLVERRTLRDLRRSAFIDVRL